MGLLLLDLRRGFRSLRRSSAMFAASVLSLGLGIGATCLTFSLVDAFALRAVSARSPERLVSLGLDRILYAQFQQIRNSGIFEDVATASQCFPPIQWTDGELIRQVIGTCVSGNFFRVLGAPMALGPGFDPRETEAEKEPRVVVVGSRFWKHRLGADPAILSRQLILNGLLYHVVGVLPPDHRSILGMGIDPDIYIPESTAIHPQLFGVKPSDSSKVHPIGRLSSGRTASQTQQALRTLLEGTADRTTTPVLKPITGFANLKSEDAVVRIAVSALAVSILVLLVACANVAGLLLVHGVSRRREFSIATALGATRSQLMRQVFVESAAISISGAITGIVICLWTGQLLSSLEIPRQDVIVRFQMSPDWRLLFVAIATTSACAILSGLLPAATASKSNLQEVLRVGSSAMIPRLKLRSIISTMQVAISVTLVNIALLQLQNVRLMLNANAGFDIDHITWFEMAFSRAERIKERDRLVQNLTDQPGVEAISWAWYVPYQLSFEEPVIRSGTDSGGGWKVIQQGVGPAYFQTMRIPLLLGREFERNDLSSASTTIPPVVVNQTLARVVFGRQDVVGERILRVAADGKTSPMIIIGVANDTHFQSPWEAPRPLLHSLASLTPNLIIRTKMPAESGSVAVSRAMDRESPGKNVGFFTMRERANGARFPAFAAATLLGLLAFAAVLLALIGLYGQASYEVVRRTPEIGIRMAVGAAPLGVMTLMLRDGLRPAITGSTLGVMIAIPVVRLTGNMLALRDEAGTPMLSLCAVLLVVIGAVTTIWFQAKRASRLDPVTALRSDQ